MIIRKLLNCIKIKRDPPIEETSPVLVEAARIFISECPTSVYAKWIGDWIKYPKERTRVNASVMIMTVGLLPIKDNLTRALYFISEAFSDYTKGKKDSHYSGLALKCINKYKTEEEEIYEPSI